MVGKVRPLMISTLIIILITVMCDGYIIVENRLDDDDGDDPSLSYRVCFSSPFNFSPLLDIYTNLKVTLLMI